MFETFLESSGRKSCGKVRHLIKKTEVQEETQQNSRDYGETGRQLVSGAERDVLNLTVK